MNNSEELSMTGFIGSDEAETQEDQSTSSLTKQSLFQRLENIASLSQVIRAFGACAIIASMSLFMLQGWAEGNDINRYLKLLAQTGLLTGAGLVLSFLIKEFKGARVFFGLALVSVIANFTILGSLTYSLFAIDTQMVSYPDSMKWEVVEGALFLPMFLGALFLLSAVTYFGFSVFSRKIAKPLTLSLLGLSVLLLIPVREPLIAVGLSAIALLTAWALIQRVLIPRLGKTDIASGSLVMTKETKTSLGLLLLPGLIILTRAVSFYHIDDLTLLAFSSILFLTCRNLCGAIEANSLIKRLLEISQLGLGVFIATMVTKVLPLALISFSVFTGALVFVGFVFEQLRNNSDHKWKELWVNLTALALVPITLLHAMLEYELIYSVQALLICGLVFVLMLKANHALSKPIFSHTIAVVGIVVASLMVGVDLIQLAKVGNWVVIGLSGATLIIGASLYERFGLKLLTN